jgi:hypothetical protein
VKKNNSITSFRKFFLHKLADVVSANVVAAKKFEMRNVRGQALTEFLVASLAIIPLFLLVPLIGKYQDIANATMLAGRYAAFDGATHNIAQGGWKPSTQLADELRRRFFSNSDAAIKTNDTAGNFKSNQNLLWVDPQNRALIVNFGSDVRLGYGVGNNVAHSMADFSSASDSKLFNSVVDYPSQLKLVAYGIYQANVSVTIANISASSGLLNVYKEFENINLVMNRSTSLVVDPWSADGALQAEQRFGGDPRLFPAAPLSNVAKIVDAEVRIVDALGGLQGPKLGQLEFWRDVVPIDRLK